MKMNIKLKHTFLHAIKIVDLNYCFTLQIFFYFILKILGSYFSKISQILEYYKNSSIEKIYSLVKTYIYIFTNIKKVSCEKQNNPF